MARKTDLGFGETIDKIDKDDLGGQIEILRNEISDMAGKLSSLIASKSSTLGHSIGAKVAEGVERTAAHASELTAASLESLHAAKGKAKDASVAVLDAVSAEVRRNPARTLAVALGVGLILGLWSRPR